jgi:hypothetical protein
MQKAGQDFWPAFLLFGFILISAYTFTKQAGLPA